MASDLFICGHYHSLFHQYLGGHLHFYPFTPDCQRAPGKKMKEGVFLVGWGCPWACSENALVMPTCYDLFYEGPLGGRDYLMTPDWLSHWQEHLEKEGWTLEATRHFFQHTFHRGLLLGGSEQLTKAGQAFERAMGIPIEQIPVDGKRPLEKAKTYGLIDSFSIK